MKRLRDLVGCELKWIQPRAMKRGFELKNGEETVAVLDFRSAFGSLATAGTAEGSWTFKRVGFWSSRVTIRPADHDQEIAIFRNSTWSAGGSLEMADGRRDRANTNFWMTSFEFKGDGDEPLVRFVKIRGMVHLSSMVEITPAGARLPELPWIVALGWYLTVKMQDDAAGAGAAAAGAG